MKPWNKIRWPAANAVLANKPFADLFAEPDPVTLINADIDRLVARIPALPAWAAHQICGWSWAARDLREPAEAYIECVRAESEYSHSEGAHL